jgi:hypothetical protein
MLWKLVDVLKEQKELLRGKFKSLELLGLHRMGALMDLLRDWPILRGSCVINWGFSE